MNKCHGGLECGRKFLYSTVENEKVQIVLGKYKSSSTFLNDTEVPVFCEWLTRVSESGFFTVMLQ